MNILDINIKICIIIKIYLLYNITIMTPPVRSSIEDVEITTDELANKFVDNLTNDELLKILKSVNKRMWIKEKTTKKKENNNENLLNKPNMTQKDKENMEKSIKFLVDKKMYTSKNLKKLEAINYGSNYIEIGWVKRARENLKAEPNNKNIFKCGDEIYFKFDALEEQNKLLANQGMEIPRKDDFIKSLEALPWKFSEDIWYAGGNILWNILDLSISGSFIDDHKFYGEGEYGYVWSFSEYDSEFARNFTFSKDRSTLTWENKNCALPVRPVLK